MKWQQSRGVLYLIGSSHATDKWTYSDADLPKWVLLLTLITAASTMGKRKHQSRESTGGVENLYFLLDLILGFGCRLV
jgi:hypothetical protein